MIKDGCKNKSALLILLTFHLKRKSQKSILWSKRIQIGWKNHIVD